MIISSAFDALALAAKYAAEGDIVNALRFRGQAWEIAQGNADVFESMVYLDVCFHEFLHRCLKERREGQNSKECVYFVLAQSSNAIKIGTTTDIKQRLKAIQCCQSEPLKLLKFIEGGSQLEAALHQKFRMLHLSGEWFKADKSLLNYIKKLNNFDTNSG